MNNLLIIDKNKYLIARARAGIINEQKQIGVQHNIAKKIQNEEPVQLRVVIRIAKALGVDPAEIVKEVNA